MRVAWAILLAVVCQTAAAAFYGKNSGVLNLTPKNFDAEVYGTNHTTLVEFYADWCGHCKNLRPHYAKAAQSVGSLAKVAAVRCDEAGNEALCSRFRVKGYPTLKVFRAQKSAPGKPIVEDYTGARTAKAMADGVLGRIANHVRRLGARDVAAFVAGPAPKAVLFQDKSTTPAMWKSLAIDFLGAIDFGVVRKTEQAAVDEYGVTEFPTVLVFRNGAAEKYTGALKKDALYGHLATVAPPTEGPLAPARPKGKAGKGKAKKGSKGDEL
ncbi:thioredoxin-like protein [Dipodascopsis tothii]|uniref:thioredoxin-like protein n=1 Tax=Dipodascopsis tothii TaxID=44089 RepID=UPI0034CE7DA9